MKTLKTFLEVRRPKSADERRFMDKHVVVRYPDRNGNGDDLFKAANIKTIKRDKEGHGYDTGKDAKVYENVQNAVLEYLDKMGIEVTEIELGELVEDLQEELLGELSDQTLKSYIKKAGRSATIHDDSAKGLMGYSKKWKNPKNIDLALDGAAKSATKSVKRVKGIIRAAKKIKEEVQLDEISQKMARAYRDKAGEEKDMAIDDRKFYRAHKDNVDHEDNVIRKRGKGLDIARKKIQGYARVNVKESNEELDELFSLTIEDLSDKNQAVLSSLYESLDLENQINLVETLQEDGGLDEVLDFALDEAVKSYQVSGEHKENGNVKTLSYFAKNPAHAKKQFHAYHDRKKYTVNGVKRLKEETLDEGESPIAGTKKVSSHEGKDGHTHEIRYDKDNEEYSVHHYKDGKHLGEGPVSYHSDKAEAKDQVNYDVKNFKR